MKIFGFGALVILGLSLVSFGQEKAKVTIDDLDWIAGCWENKGKTEGSYTMEHWTKPAGMMLAVSRTVKNGRVGFFEYLRIIEKGADVYYVAKPANAEKETSFKLTSLENNNAVFENPEHDFPQRIVYKLENEDSIAVRVEAEKDGKPSGFGFSMKKVSCDQ
ncbi:MAG: DUF6265 family protein [Pyrinomonadaceae bacterium]